MVGEAEAFAVFVRAHGRSLYGTAYVLCGDADAAEEIVQDTLARLYPQWDRVIAADAPLAYVRRALVNGFVSRKRRPASRELGLWEIPDGPSGLDVGDEVTSRALLMQMLGELPARQRAALVMHYLYDMVDADIAATLGCRQATVRSLRNRGIATVRGRYATAARPDLRKEGA
jgi:RNA polymerase sigma-70 factor (sigma-E family)